MTENKIYRLKAGYYHNYTGIGKHKEENYTTNEVCDLLNQKDKRIKELEKEKECWKLSACHDTNLKSMLSREIEKLTETKDIDAFLEFYYTYFCNYKKKKNGDKK